MTDPSTVDTAAGFSYLWHVTDSNGQTITDGTAANFTFTPDDNGSYSVSLTATDKDGGVSTAAVDAITVTNVAPTASITNPVTTSPEGTSITLDSAVTDPSTVDTTAGFSYLWHVTDSNGQTITDGTGANFTFTPDDNGSYSVSLTATDKDGGVSTAAVDAISVTNVAPTATFGNNGPVNEGSPVTVSFSGQSDPSTADTAAGFQYAYALSESGLSTATPSGSATSQFTFTTFGNDTVWGRIIDKDGGYTDYSTTFMVNNVAPSNVTISGLPASSPEGDADHGDGQLHGSGQQRHMDVRLGHHRQRSSLYGPRRASGIRRCNTCDGWNHLQSHVHVHAG